MVGTIRELPSLFTPVLIQVIQKGSKAIGLFGTVISALRGG